jgi:hypothetical protein
MRESPPELAFALGGLAGNNAHGAGFLQAALDEGFRPDMISCTSGQIRWVYHYLRDPSERKLTLRQLMEEAIASMAPYQVKVLDYLKVVAQGVPAVCRPVWPEFPLEYIENVAAMMHRAFRSPFDFVLPLELLRTIPCRLMTPEHSPDYFKEMSRVFNASEIGIVFNSFNPVGGTENVYLNDTARRLLREAKKKGGKSAYLPGEKSSYRERTTYQSITPDAIRDALWLYNYGFDPEDRPDAHALFVDGAYFRQIILNELTPVRCIFVARPIHHEWVGALPTNWADLEDFKTKLLFNGTYDGERHQILLINKLLGKNRANPNEIPTDRDDHTTSTADDGPAAASEKTLVDPEGYHPIELIEVEPKRLRGFIDYILEDIGVFDDAYTRARDRIQEYKQRSLGAGRMGDPGTDDARIDLANKGNERQPDPRTEQSVAATEKLHVEDGDAGTASPPSMHEVAGPEGISSQTSSSDAKRSTSRADSVVPSPGAEDKTWVVNQWLRGCVGRGREVIKWLVGPHFRHRSQEGRGH